MASTESKLTPRVTFFEIPDLEEVESKTKDLILTLPVDQRLATPIRQYQGFWCWEKVLPGILSMQEKFKCRPNDIIVASFPKSGTTWLKALTFTVVNRGKFSLLSQDHPLLKLNPHDCVPLLDHTYAGRNEQCLETLSSPRVLNTHSPYSLLPESMKTSDCPIVYICRDPKDNLVSLWHMVAARKPFPFNQAFESFCEGRSPYGPIWDHVLEYYTLSLQNPKKILFLKYEGMKDNPIDSVIRLANFVGCPFSEEELKENMAEKVVKFCSFNKLKGLEVNKYDATSKINDGIYFRKGVVGDWKNYLTAEMAAKLDNITKEKFQHSGFTY